ncbi:MAG: endo-1,4-beta-xylanase, partial [Planctomycetes bacterium]|nr:endo-1,4-beta-xylanase [Planctomycetota bacterium]
MRRLSLAFLNDHYDPAQGEDRNLLLARIRIGPAEKGGADVSKAAPPDWRKESDEGIARHRAGDLALRVLGADGKPLAGARVRALLVRHAFPFGCAVTSALADPDWRGQDRENFERLYAELFNFAVHENALKWQSTNREGSRADFGAADRILAWCRERGIGMRGHCILWDDEKWIPAWARELPDGEFRTAVLSRIREVAGRYRGEIREHDLNNEMIHLGYLGRRFGKEFYAELFRTAKEADPDARFFVNDFNILTGVDLEAYARHTEGLIRAGAPVGGIGCQGHFDRAPDPLTVRMSLDRLAKLGLPIEVT